MNYEFTTVGALIGLAVAIILIIKKLQPAYSLILGALIGGVIGSGSLVTTVNTMISGGEGMISSVLRIMTSGILAGTLIKTGAAEKIAEVIVEKLGEKRALAAISLATMIICAVVVTILLSTMLSKKQGVQVTENDLEQKEDKNLPSFIQAVAGPVVVVILLALRPVASIVIDPLIALPVGGVVCALACGQIKNIREYTEFGLGKVVGVSVLLIGTGTIAGIIKASALQYDVVHILKMANMPAFLLAPIAGILMAGATASTTAGATIGAQTFAGTLVKSGVSALSAGAMVHTGATVIDSLPHGSFFHATGGAAGLEIKERMKLIPYEMCVGLTSTVVAVIMYVV